MFSRARLLPRRLGPVCKQSPSPVDLWMTNRGDLNNEQWARLVPLLPPQKPKVGRPAEDHRRILNGILWKVRTGAPWRDLPERYGPWPTVASRLRRWRLAGVWDRVFAAAQERADAEGRLDWDVQFVDGSTIRAHQHAAGGKGGPRSKRSAGAGAATRPRSPSGRRAGASRSASS
jgi:transposase